MSKSQKYENLNIMTSENILPHYGLVNPFSDTSSPESEFREWFWVEGHFLK